MEDKKLTAANGRPVADNQNVQTVGPRGPMVLQDPWFIEKLAHFDREVIPERRMHSVPLPLHMISQSIRKRLFSAR